MTPGRGPPEGAAAHRSMKGARGPVPKAPSPTVSSTVDVSEMMGSEVYLHVTAAGKDVVLRIPTTELPEEHRAGIPYGTAINFAFRPELIHLFDPQTEKNLLY